MESTGGSSRADQDDSVVSGHPSVLSDQAVVINPASALPVIVEELDLNGNPSFPASPSPYGYPPGYPHVYPPGYPPSPSQLELPTGQILLPPNAAHGAPWANHLQSPSNGVYRHMSDPNIFASMARALEDRVLGRASWTPRGQAGHPSRGTKAPRVEDDLGIGRGRGGGGGVESPKARWTAPNTPKELTNHNLYMLDPLALQTRLLGFLCAERVTQMTRTYNDIEAVTRLLEEQFEMDTDEENDIASQQQRAFIASLYKKERDLELAARIGQTLLEKNKELQDRSEQAEDQLANANDKVNQLRHDLSLKEELLRVYCQDFDNDVPSGTDSPPEKTGVGLALVDINSLQKKVQTLEDENLQLRCESVELRQETNCYEEKEKKLVEDCLQQLAEVNQQVEVFAEELTRKTDENSRQKEEITAHLAQLVDLQKRVRCLTVENMELSKHLQASQESQRKLTKELGTMKDRYDELMELLKETQTDLKNHRRQQTPGVKHPYLSSSMISAPTDSLASELETSLRQELEHSSDSELTPMGRKARSWKVFETARAARKAGQKAVAAYYSSSSSLADASDGGAVPSQRFAAYVSDPDVSDGGYVADQDSLYGSNPDLGRPGIPGSNDLETALRRLALRRANELNEQDFHQDEERRFRQSGAAGSVSMAGTPGSELSSNSNLSCLSFPGNPALGHAYRFPERLQIVKPMEGSMTLRQWQQLATPKLTGLFEERPGVQNKGERKLDLFEEEFRLSDFEEDDLTEDSCHTRRCPETPSMFTFTNSLVKHINEPPPQNDGDSTSTLPAAQSTPKSTMTRASLGGGTTTYSMSLGLAAILQERDLNASSGLRHRVAANPTRVKAIITDSLHRARCKLASQAEADARYSTASSAPTTAVSASDSCSGGLLNRVKSTGFALLDYLSAGRSPSQTSLDADGDRSAFAGEATPEALASDGVVAAPQGASEDSSPQMPLARGGVLGALTSFRKTGLL